MTGPRRLNILVVDDEAGTRMPLAAVLKLGGHEARFARDGDEALEAFEQAAAPFDLIITDHLMVRVSGLDLVRRLRERGFAGEIVILTGYAAEIEEKEYRRLEVAGIMGKPFDIAQLRNWLGCIDGCRERSRTLDERPCPPGAADFSWLEHGQAGMA